MAFGAQRSWSSIGHVEASAGDVIMVNPGEMHDGYTQHGEKRGWRMLYLSPALFANAIEDEFSRTVDIVLPVVRDPVLVNHFSGLFSCVTDRNSDPIEREGRLVQILTYIARQHAMDEQRPRVFTPPCVAKAMERIDSAPQIPVSLAELAALSGISRFQLLRGFARETGATPHAYLVQRRIRLVRQLLTAGQTLSEAALQAGFADQSHMTRAFVRQFGISPGRYREAIA